MTQFSSHLCPNCGLPVGGNSKCGVCPGDTDPRRYCVPEYDVRLGEPYSPRDFVEKDGDNRLEALEARRDNKLRSLWGVRS